MSDNQLYNGSDHKTFGPAEPPDCPETPDDRWYRISRACDAYEPEGGGCEINGNYCMDNKHCPDGKF